MSMTPTVRLTGYGLGAAASVLLAMTLLNSSSADAAVSRRLVKSMYFATGSVTLACPVGGVATDGGVGADLTTYRCGPVASRGSGAWHRFHDCTSARVTPRNRHRQTMLVAPPPFHYARDGARRYGNRP